MALISLLLFWAAFAFAQQAITPQSNTWNSNFSLSRSQIARAGFNGTTANNVNVAVCFERTNWATGSVHDDPFYRVPENASGMPAGSVLKVEQYTNTSAFTMPPNTALSRILFQSETLNGPTVPASAFVLWPWMPRRDPRTGKYAAVGWGHGTSGVFGENAPSHIRNLWYQYSAPYILALQGYVVVAPDYAGLGVDRYANGTEIRHAYLSNPSHANDLFRAVEAAQKAWRDDLSKYFVLMGHSQGGGAAWGAAQRQAKRPVAGFLGTIAGSPVTDLVAQENVTQAANLPFYIGYGLEQTLPGFNVSEFLTAKGVRHLDLFREVGGGQSVALQIDSQDGLFQPEWWLTPYMQAFVNLTRNGGLPIEGPMLVLQGTADPAVPNQVTDAAVKKTCAAYPGSQIEYAIFEGATHVPVLYASQRIWLDWIADRFAGRETAAPCTRSFYSPARKLASYQTELELYLELATQPYEVA
ncbi:hypothetical protein B0A50_00146 [Salinomyces thailandicus]|uniref:Serine aminopeptidase S33 domain-containing protein n=1 Tax=Salinomyces thailandicus TaxID=706561 RepID=A0A4U0UHF8_9PEZI|nr:hypothetical protein B0A50_00146 [Salinomyces thailandica]